MDFQTWLSFAGASFVLSLAPGPDNIFVLMQSVIYGRSAGLKVVLGLCTGLLVHTILVTIGVSAVIRASALAFTGLKIAGALYLLYLAYMAWKAPAVPMEEEKAAQKRAENNSFLKWWSRGFIMNLTNPKVIIFFLAFFPQFITTGQNTELQMIIMGATFICATIIVFGSIAVFAELVRKHVSSDKVQRAINRTGAVIFALLAASLIFST